MTRLEELRAAMVASFHGNADRALVQWVTRHHGSPQSLDSTRLRAIVLDFDTFLMQPGTEDSELTRAIIRLRNVFARHAKMAPPATVMLGPRPSPAPGPAAVEAEEVAPPRAGVASRQPLVTDEDVPPYSFDANSLLAEALSRLLSAPSWVEAIGVPPHRDAHLGGTPLRA